MNPVNTITPEYVSMLLKSELPYRLSKNNLQLLSKAILHLHESRKIDAGVCTALLKEIFRLSDDLSTYMLEFLFTRNDGENDLSQAKESFGILRSHITKAGFDDEFVVNLLKDTRLNFLVNIQTLTSFSFPTLERYRIRSSEEDWLKSCVEFHQLVGLSFLQDHFTFKSWFKHASYNKECPYGLVCAFAFIIEAHDGKSGVDTVDKLMYSPQIIPFIEQLVMVIPELRPAYSEMRSRIEKIGICKKF